MYLSCSSTILVVLAAGLMACDKPAPEVSPAKDTAATQPAEPKPQPLVLKWEKGFLSMVGDGPDGVAASIWKAAEGLKDPNCGIRHVAFESVVPRHGALVFAPLSLADVAELICGSATATVTFDWDARTITGEAMFRTRALEKAFSQMMVAGDGEGWAYTVSLSTDPDGDLGTQGRLFVSGDNASNGETWTIRPVVDGENLEEPIKGGWRGLLEPGIYEASNGDHFAIRAGFETHFVPANPAAIFVSGRRFPLDDHVPIHPRIVALGSESHDPDSIDSCDTGNKRKRDSIRCGVRYLKPGTPIALNDISGLRDAVKRVLLHSDSKADAAAAREDLRAKGLSTHLLIDFDGTIHQSVDLALVAYHAGEASNTSIGIDLNNLSSNLVKEPTAPMYPDPHPRLDEMREHPRPKSDVATINGERVQTYGYTEAQYRSLLSLSRLLLRLFPDVEPEFPKSDDGTYTRVVLGDWYDFNGFLGHNATEADRVDPGPGFDWPRLATAFEPKARPSGEAAVGGDGD